MLNKIVSLLSLICIIFFVYADIICENVLIIINNDQSRFFATIYLFIFFILQIFFAAIQSGLSDIFGRKESLIISFSASLFSLLLIFIYYNFHLSLLVFLILSLLIKSFLGNTIPLSFAAIADTQRTDRRGSYALASSTYAFAFITLILMNKISHKHLFFIVIAIIIMVFSLLICIYFFKDASDKSAHLPKNLELKNSQNFIKNFYKLGTTEIFLLLKELKRPLTKYALISYILWEISIYSVIISQVDLNPGPSQNITFAMMISYLFGVIILKIKPIKKINDRVFLSFGYAFSFLSLILYFFLSKNAQKEPSWLGICYSIHALGNAFLSPTILSIITKQRSIHDQGKILGLVESSDTIAFLLSSTFVMIYSTNKWPIIILILFSLISFSVSWIYFPIINRLDKIIDK